MAASFAVLGVSAGINVAAMVVFVVLYSIFSRQPINARVYFTKWFVVDQEDAVRRLEKIDDKGEETHKAAVELSPRSYLGAADWLVQALMMPQLEFINHVGLDGFAFLRLFQLGMKIFGPMALLGFVVLVPVNATDNYVDQLVGQDAANYGEIDRITLANVQNGSNRLWAHFIMAYVFTFWTWYVLWKEYKEMASLRLDFLSDQKKTPDQFAVLVRQVPADPFESISKHVDHFFTVNHPDYYAFNQVVFNANKLESLEEKKNWVVNKLTALHIQAEKKPDRPPATHKTGCWGCCGARVDSVQFYGEELTRLNAEIDKERSHVLNDPSLIMPAAFVTFRKRWGAAVAAQTQQSRDSSQWITQWAPEPRDVFWANLPIPYIQLNGRKLAVTGAFTALTLFYLIPVTIVQSLASLDGLQQKLPWLSPVLSIPFVNAFLQGFLPGLALKIFLAVLPMICILLSQLEGWVSNSIIERKAMGKYYAFLVVNVFCASVVTGTIFKEVKAFLERPTNIPTTFGNTIPTKAVFFMTYVMVDGWASITAELFRLIPMIIYHFRGLLLVRTPKDREKAMNVSGVPYNEVIPQILLYFTLGFVYCVITPLMLPFLLVFFGLGYLIYRNQLINVYDAQYESAASFWPAVHGRTVAGLVISQVILVGIFVVKKAEVMGPLLVPLPILTMVWHVIFCKNTFENAFKKFSLEEAMKKDTIDAAFDDQEQTLVFLHNAYLNPAVKRALHETDEEVALWRKRSGLDGARLVPLKRYPVRSKSSSHLTDSESDGPSKREADGDAASSGVSTPVHPPSPMTPMRTGTEPLLRAGKGGRSS